ncbi:ATP-binding cassette domain-containing protein [Erysipelothrix piscisicarius]|uniref:ATP-binding cassette domain-containing protein n=1 Tax=Erysipelothrix piscisicarius TaxID=2485784 RepID=UPI002F93D95F
MALLEIKNLHTYFDTKRGLVKAVNGVSFSVDEGRTLGIVGESGSGKSQTAMSILQLFESNQRIYEGEIVFNGEVLSDYTEEQLRKIRGNDISMIFQEPMTSLNPVFTVERQISAKWQMMLLLCMVVRLLKLHQLKQSLRMQNIHIQNAY